MSSTTISSIPSALPGTCNSQVSFQPPEGNVSRPFCAFNWPTPITDLQDCCNDGAEILTFNNCTQYCEHSGNQQSWLNCIVEKEPAADVRGNQFPCWIEQSTTTSGTPTVSVTTSVQTSDLPATSTISTSEPTNSDPPESDGTGSESRPFSTFFAWASALTAVVAGLVS